MVPPSRERTLSPKDALRAIFRQIKAWGIRDGKIGLESLLPRYVADFIYGLCNVRKRVDDDFSGISAEKAAEIVTKAMPLVPYP